jgi:hypothetical protein
VGEPPELIVAVVARVGSPDRPAFQLRKGEGGLSVFEPSGVDPPLTEAEILEHFRPGSIVVYRTVAQVIEVGLMLLPTPGADVLPERLRTAHREIAPGPGMERPAFKAALKILE